MSENNSAALSGEVAESSRRLIAARILLVSGLLVGLGSWKETIGHVGDPRYMLLPGFAEGATHAWYHAFRGSCCDVAQMIVFLIVFFAPSRFRTRETWLMLLVLMLGYYSPF
jgi:hypothetical protein